MKNRSRSIRVNAVYNVINQSCVILFQLISIKYVSSILRSSNFGRVNFCNSILGYFLLFAQLGISSYMIREGSGIRDNKEQINKLANEVYTINLLSTMMAVLFYFFIIIFWNRLHSEKVILYTLGIQLFLNLFNVEWINNIFEDFKFIAIRNLLIQIVSFMFIVLFVKQEMERMRAFGTL